MFQSGTFPNMFRLFPIILQCLYWFYGRYKGRNKNFGAAIEYELKNHAERL